VVDAFFSSRVLAAVTQFTYFQTAQHQLVLAAFSLSIFAAIYYLAPRIVGAAWPSSSLARAHYMASIIGFTVLICALAIAGWRQGVALNNPELNFTAIAGITRPWLLVATAAQGLLVVGNLALGIHFVRLMLTKSTAESLAKFNQPSALEASS